MEQEQASLAAVYAVRQLFAAEAERDTAKAEQLNRALALMQELHPNPDQPEPNQVPGCRHLARALDLGEAGPAAAVATAIRGLEPSLVWAQNPRYNADNMGAGFMDNYGWSSLGWTGSSAMACGVLLRGPGIIYPPTSYESEGVFLVIGGSPEWKSGDEDWTRMNAGDIVCRPFGGSEGKRPGSEPMLALYAWMYR